MACTVKGEVVVDKRANILLVDDKPQNLVVLESILDAPENRLIRAYNANQALEALLAQDIAAIVLDVEMPEMGGLELARLIKGCKKTEHIPILFLTARFIKDQRRGRRGLPHQAGQLADPEIQGGRLRGAVSHDAGALPPSGRKRHC
jgi:CheY-like chemotaxis protein